MGLSARRLHPPEQHLPDGGGIRQFNGRCHMAAKRDKSRNTYFAVGPHTIGTCMAKTVGGAGGSMVINGYADKKAWTVCEHLSTPEKVLAYHQGGSPILIVHGFVLCQECNNRNILTGQDGFNKMLRNSVPQDDIFFQKLIMKEEIPDEYCYWVKLLPGNDEKYERSKHVCVHLKTSRKLNAHYASRQTLFWHQDSLLCADCLDEAKNGKSNVIEENRVRLHEKIFTERIIGPLCLTNTKHFGLQG
jgi:hypothetical protein